MAERETSRGIDADAAAWVAREDRAALSSAEQKVLAEWLAGDPRRAGALLRARAIALRSQSARALGKRYDPVDFGGDPSGLVASRRRILTWGGGLAASMATVAVVGATLRAPQAHATERGEIRLVPLADGSTVMLNTATRVKVKYDDGHRRVRLMEGEADFTVLADRGRPFVVEVGRRRFTATAGGAFRVRKLGDGPVDILVHQGRVEVEPTKAAGRAVVMGANTRLSVSASEPTIRIAVVPQIIPPGDVTRDLAWRQGKIAFEGQTLAQAAAAFARYSDTRIVIADPALARETITGLFAANDPAGFGRAVAGVFGAPVTTRDNAVVVGRAPAAQ